MGWRRKRSNLPGRAHIGKKITMAVPTYEEIMPPTLAVLNKCDKYVSSKELDAETIEVFDLNAEERAERTPSGNSNLYKNNANWARQYLKHAGLIESRQGRSGFALAQKPEDIALLDIWRAVTEEQDFHIFDLHQNPNDACIVGRNIRPVLGDIFSGMEREVEAMLAETTLADCISRMEKRVEKAGQNEKEDAR